MSELLVDQFYDLFQGREDAVLVDPPRQVKEPDIEDYVHQHLSGPQNIAIYPMREGREVKWICTDIDTGDTKGQAWDLHDAWQYYGITSWVETSKSKGHHVWVFCEDWVPAIIARRAGLFIHEMAQVPATELNPKQELTEGFGNCVRIPYPRSRNPGRQSVLKHDGSLYTPDEFAERALGTRTPIEPLQRLAQMWTPRPRQVKRNQADSSSWNENSDFLAKRVFADENEMIPEGGRDNTFFVLACYMHARGFEKSEAMNHITEIWNNQTENKETFPLRAVQEKIHRVYEQGRPN